MAGGSVKHVACRSLGSNPAGTITFTLYGPNDATCTVVAFTDTKPVSGNADYTSSSFTAIHTRIYCSHLRYSYALIYIAAGPTACADAAEAVEVTKASPALSTTASGSVVFFFNDTATTEIYTLSLHDALPIFTLYGPNDATCTVVAFTDTKPVSGNADYTSSSFTAIQAGTYRWIASYTGDLNNNAAGPTACADPAEAVVVTKAAPALTTTASGSVAAGGFFF